MISTLNEAQIWEQIEIFFKEKFNQENTPDVETMIFLIGLQELGFGYKKYKKDEKMNLMHIAVCRLLEPFGYYKLESRDKDNWPHYKLVEKLPELKPNEQTILMRKAIIQYFIDEEIL